MPGPKKQQSIRFDESLVEKFRALSPGHEGLSIASIFDFALRVTIETMSAKKEPMLDLAAPSSPALEDDGLDIGL